MFKELSLAGVRHALTGLGPLIASTGFITGTDWDKAIGAVIFLIGLGVSITRKLQNKPRRI